MLTKLATISARLGGAPSTEEPACEPRAINTYRRPPPAPRFDPARLRAFEGNGYELPVPQEQELPERTDEEVDAYIKAANSAPPHADGPESEASTWAVLWRGINRNARCAWVFENGFDKARALPHDLLRAWAKVPAGWHLHRPGDPMPCAGDTVAHVFLRGGGQSVGKCYVRASEWVWGQCLGCEGAEIIAWRPAE